MSSNSKYKEEIELIQTHEMEKDFRSRYDELLHSCGFKFKKDAFYRCHANDVLLVISTIKRFPYFEVTFDALPFSCAYTDDGKWRGWGIDWFMANRAKRLGIAYERNVQDAYEVRNQRMYDDFSSVIFPELNKVCSLDTYFAYEEWFARWIRYFLVFYASGFLRLYYRQRLFSAAFLVLLLIP